MKVSGPNGIAIENGSDGFVTISVERYEHLRNIEIDIDKIRSEIAANADKIAIEYRAHGLMRNSYAAMTFVGKDEALEKLSNELQIQYDQYENSRLKVSVLSDENENLRRANSVPEESFAKRIRFLFTGLR